MKMELAHPWRNPSGTYKTTDLVLFEAGGQIVARSKIVSANPDTAGQRTIRSAMAVCSRNWKTLSAETRAKWEAYCGRYYRKDEFGHPCRRPASSVYLQVNSVRLVLGLALSSEPPRDGCPLRLRAIEQLDGVEPGAIGIRVFHDYPSVEGYQVIVRATGPLKTRNLMPPVSAYRYVCGLTPRSAQPLPTSGGGLVFTDAQSPVVAGQHYAIEARIVRTADGLLSAPVTRGFIRAD